MYTPILHTAACTKCPEAWAGSFGDMVRAAEGHERLTALAGDYHSCNVRVNGEAIPRAARTSPGLVFAVR